MKKTIVFILIPLLFLLWNLVNEWIAIISFLILVIVVTKKENKKIPISESLSWGIIILFVLLLVMAYIGIIGSGSNTPYDPRSDYFPRHG